jgi:hypothetical protein
MAYSRASAAGVLFMIGLPARSAVAADVPTPGDDGSPAITSAPTFRAAPSTIVAAPKEPPPKAEIPWGFYRDREGRVMQVSFDLQKRAWLGVAYAPRRRPTGAVEIAPAAFDFGVAFDESSDDGLTRHRLRIFDGEVRLHPFGLDVTAIRYDLSHRYEHPLVRVTTFFGEPARHDLYMNIGFYTEALHLDTAPRGVAGEQELTLGTAQGTLDLWQSADLRSYVRLRAGPGVQVRFGPWGEVARVVGLAPQTTLEGNLILGKRALQQLNFSVRGDFLRSVTWTARPLPGNWTAAVEGAYEAILLAVNDQPVSLRLAFNAGVRDDAPAPPDAAPSVAGSCCSWEWKATAGVRMSFFSPPVVPIVRR